MEHLRLSKPLMGKLRMRNLGRRFIIGCVLASAALLSSLLVFQIWIAKKVEAASPLARPAIEAVLKAQFWSKFSGSYWENEMVKQSESVARLSLQERLDYYRTILLQSDLDTSRALLFVDAVGNDAEALRQNLITFKSNPQYRDLSPERQKVVNDWIYELNIIAQQRTGKH